jgi:hypothetical protein
VKKIRIMSISLGAASSLLLFLLYGFERKLTKFEEIAYVVLMLILVISITGLCYTEKK